MVTAQRLLIVLLVLACSNALYVHTHLSTSADFVFLGKFCYDTSGEGSLVVMSETAQANQLALLLYDDETNSWPAVYGSSLSCQDRIQKAKNANQTKLLGIPNVPQNYFFSDHYRPHLWFVALANCGGQHYEIDISLSFTQHQNNWNKQFSYDQQGLLLMYILFFILFALGTLVHLYGDYQLLRARSLHPIVRLLTVSILLYTGSLFCYLIHWGVFEKNGMGVPAMYIIAQILDAFSMILFMVLLILIAKGWGITFPTISHIQQQRIIFLGLIVLFFAIYIALMIWDLVGIDPGSSLYIYQSPPGIVYLVIRFCTLLYMLWCVQGTIRREDTNQGKRTFYYIFGFAYTVWFLALPFMVVLALWVFHPWNRLKAVVALYLIICTYGFAILAYLLWPSRAAQYFKVAVPDLITTGYERL